MTYIRSAALRSLSALVLLAALGGSAAAENLRFSRTSPSSQVSQPFSIAATGDISTRGWDCPGGGGPTTKTAAITFDVDAPTTIRLRLEDGKGGPFFGGGVLVAGGKYLCTDDHNQITLDFPRGHYELYPYGNARTLAGVVRFEIPDRAKDGLARALKSLPTLTLGGPGAINPSFASAAPTTSIAAAEAGETCFGEDQRGMPIAAVDVRRSANWLIRTSTPLFIRIDHTCYHLGGDASLPAGRHVLWAILPGTGAAPRTFQLEIDDRDAPLEVADAPHHALGALDAPLFVDGTVRAEAPRFSRDVCPEVSRAPDFYVTADHPLQSVTLSVVHAASPQAMTVLGPVEKGGDLTCSDDLDGGRFSVTVLEGSYAVWVRGHPGDHYQVQVTRKGVTVDPMTLVGALPASMSIAERAVRFHYPNFDRMNGDRGALYLAAPDALFVYTRADVEGTDVKAGEPLLVDFANRDKIAAWRHDGQLVDIPTELVTGDRPARLSLPTTVTVPIAATVEQAQKMSGPEDDATVDAYFEVLSRYKTCYSDYVHKHDPTIGHDVDVFVISGDRVVDVSDEVARAADRRCNKKSVDAAEKKTLAAMAKTRAARWQARLAKARARFGL